MMRTLVAGVFVLAFSAELRLSPAFAQDPGQGELDQAVKLKLFAQSESDLNRVVEQCEAALQKGLSEENATFAKQLLAATLYQHAAALAHVLLDDEQPLNPRRLVLRDQALPKLEKAVQYNDQFIETYYLIAQLQALPGGDRDKAEQALAQVLALAKNDPQQRSKAFVLRGDLSADQAKKLADYNQAIDLDPANREALRKRGLFYLRNGEHEKAQQDFHRILREESDNLIALQALIEALTLMQKYDEALEQIEHSIQLDPSSSLNYTLRARIHLLQDKVDAAMEDLDRALKLEPRDVSALLLRAQVRQSKGDLSAAKRDIERALLFQPGLVQGILLRSMVSAAEGDFTSAAADLLTLINSDPKNIPWRLQLASIYAADQRPSKAIEVFGDILQDDPRNVSALRSRGDTLLSIGKQAEAIADYEAALRIDANHSGVLNNLAWVLATSPEAKLRNGQRAVELGTKACALTEYKQAHILSTLAAGYAETGDFETAIKWSTKAVQLGSGEMKKQLQAELESYQRQKPWREMQEVNERPEPTRGGGDFKF